MHVTTAMTPAQIQTHCVPQQVSDLGNTMHSLFFTYPNQFQKDNTNELHFLSSAEVVESP